MAAYVIFQIHASHDQDALQRYRKAAHPTIAAHQGRVLIARGKQKTLEGKAPAETVVLEFSSYEAALNWYESQAYQEVLKLRAHAADVDAYLVDGIAPKPA